MQFTRSLRLEGQQRLLLACVSLVRHSPRPPPGKCCQQRPWTSISASSSTVQQELGSLPAQSSANHAVGTQQLQPPAADRLMLVDAHALLYRYNFAYGPNLLTSSSGEDTSIAYGFLSTLLSLLELRPPPTHMAVVFDAPGKTFRHEVFQGYKAQRPPMPEGIKLAVPRIKEILATMGIPVLSVPGIEADDTIGSVATRAVEEGFAVAVASPDKDFFQLLQPNLQLLRPAKKGEGSKTLTGGLVPYTQQVFEAEYGLKPSQWPDALAISGDSADNVPGVPGIGIKGAQALLQQFGSLAQILENTPQIPKKRQREMMSSEEGAAAARLSLELVTIRTRLTVPLVRMPFDEIKLQLPIHQRQEAVLELLASMDFKQHAERLASMWAEDSSHKE